RLGPIYRAGTGLFTSVSSTDRTAIDHGSLPVDLVSSPEPIEQDLVDLVPGPIDFPVSPSSPAGHPASRPQLARQVFPRDARLEHEQDADQGVAVRDTGVAAFGAGRPLRQQRFDDFPKLFGQEWLGHETVLRACVATIKARAIGMPSPGLIA